MNPAQNAWRGWNSGEVAGRLSNLQGVELRDRALAVIPLIGEQRANWREIGGIDDPRLRSQANLLVDTTNADRKDAPVVLFLPNNQMSIAELSNGYLITGLREKGYVVALLEYPGYGGSLGLESAVNARAAAAGAAKYLQDVTGKRVNLIGHSIGGPLALETAARPELEGVVASVGTFGGFSTLGHQAKNQTTDPLLKLVAPLVARIVSGDNWIDGVSAARVLAARGTPMTIAHGKDDAAVPPDNTEPFARLFSKPGGSPGKTVIYPGLGHDAVIIGAKHDPGARGNFDRIWADFAAHFAK